MKTLRFLSILLLLCCLPLSAFAMDTGFIGSSEKWISNGDVVYVPLDPERFGGNLEGGYYQYYTDLAGSCFYLHISYTESSLEDNGNNNVHLNFEIENSSHEYQLNIDKHTDGGNLSSLGVRAQFSEIWISGQDIYVGIEFLNKEDKKLNNYLRFSLVVNGYKYRLCDNGIKLAYGDYADSQSTTKPTETKPSTSKESTTKQTTTKQSTTKQSTTKQTTTKQSTTKQTTTKKETTTKFKYTHTATTQATEKGSNIATEKTTKQKAESTTKFKYTGAAGSAPSDGNDQGTAPGDIAAESGDNTEENTTASGAQSGNDQAGNNIIIPGPEGTEGRAPQAKLLTAIAVICAVAGTALFVRNLPPRKKKANENSEEE